MRSYCDLFGATAFVAGSDGGDCGDGGGGDGDGGGHGGVGGGVGDRTTAQTVSERIPITRISNNFRILLFPYFVG